MTKEEDNQVYMTTRGDHLKSKVNDMKNWGLKKKKIKKKFY